MRPVSDKWSLRVVICGCLRRKFGALFAVNGKRRPKTPNDYSVCGLKAPSSISFHLRKIELEN